MSGVSVVPVLNGILVSMEVEGDTTPEDVQTAQNVISAQVL